VLRVLRVPKCALLISHAFVPVKEGASERAALVEERPLWKSGPLGPRKQSEAEGL